MKNEPHKTAIRGAVIAGATEIVLRAESFDALKEECKSGCLPIGSMPVGIDEMRFDGCLVRRRLTE